MFISLMSLFSCPWEGSGAESCGLIVMAWSTGNAVALAMAEGPEQHGEHLSWALGRCGISWGGQNALQDSYCSISDDWW